MYNDHRKDKASEHSKIIDFYLFLRRVKLAKQKAPYANYCMPHIIIIKDYKE